VTVLVTGGTGAIGRPLVDLLRSRDVPTVVASRAGGSDPALTRALDLRSGAGLDEALDGVRTVVLLHTDPRRPAQVDGAGTARLARAAKAAGVEHLLLLSIVGCDRVPFGYYKAKVVAEQALAESGTGWTVQRATQFHTVVLRLARAMRRGPLAVVPRGFASQPVDEATVVERLAELVAAGPSGRVDDLAGPQRLTLGDAVRLVAQPQRVHVIGVPVPGRMGRAFANGGNLPRRGALVRGPSFSEWVATSAAGAS
jgi:uncharacterized protein YbjT (DUF2867 family)